MPIDIKQWMSEHPWRPQVHRSLKGMITVEPGTRISYTGQERDWWIHGNTIEENLALGHLFELKDDCYSIVAWGDTEEQAIQRLTMLVVKAYEKGHK